MKVDSAGICGTDLHIIEGNHPRGKSPPLVLGYEFSAQILDMKGYTNSELHIGDRVVVEPLIPCGKCQACKRGKKEVCEDLKLYGVDEAGGFAEYAVVDFDALHPIPDSLHMRIAALSEPTAVAVHAIRRSPYKIGDRVCVIGGGAIGSLIALLLYAQGCKGLLVIEPLEYRRNILHTIGVRSESPEYVQDTKGKWRKDIDSQYDIVFDAAGVQSAVNTASFVLRPQGTMVLLALANELKKWNHIAVVFKELNIIGSRVYAAFDFPRAISFLNEFSDLFEEVISPVYTLSEGMDAFAAARSGKSKMRIIFQVDSP